MTHDEENQAVAIGTDEPLWDQLARLNDGGLAEDVEEKAAEAVE